MAFFWSRPRLVNERREDNASSSVADHDVLCACSSSDTFVSVVPRSNEKRIRAQGRARTSIHIQNTLHRSIIFSALIDKPGSAPEEGHFCFCCFLIPKMLRFITYKAIISKNASNAMPPSYQHVLFLIAFTMVLMNIASSKFFIFLINTMKNNTF